MGIESSLQLVLQRTLANGVAHSRDVSPATAPCGICRQV